MRHRDIVESLLCFMCGVGLAIGALTLLDRESSEEEEPVVEDVGDIEEAAIPCFMIAECVTLAEAIYFEARGEPTIGKIAVGFVIMTRVEKPFYKDTIEEVIYDKCHFSYTCDEKIKPLIGKIPVEKLPIQEASAVYYGTVDDPTEGADHYYNPKKVKRTPRFAKVYDKVVAIGDHHFHRRDF